MSLRPDLPLASWRCAQPHPASRRAFTVIEVLVALVIITIGLLGVAGASATAVRASNAALRERTAVTRARTRLALLQSSGCAAASTGELSYARGLADRWVVAPESNGVRLIEVRTEWDDADRRRTVLLRGALQC